MALLIIVAALLVYFNATSKVIMVDTSISQISVKEYFSEPKAQTSKSSTKINLQTVEREKVKPQEPVIYEIEQKQQKIEPSSVSQSDISKSVSVNIIAEDGTLIPWKSVLHDDMTQAELKIAQEQLIQYETQLMSYAEKLKEKEAEIVSVSMSMIPYTPKLLEGVNLTRIGIVSDTQVNAVLNGFNALPKNVQDIIIANGYRVEVTDEDIEKLITGGGTNSWYGATAGNPLYVSIISIHQTESEITRTTIHELGHAYDNSIGIVSSSAAFLSCYAAEGKTMYATADVHDASEWFSECLVYYALDPALLKQTAPNSYAFMCNLLGGGLT